MMQLPGSVSSCTNSEQKRWDRKHRLFLLMIPQIVRTATMH